MNIGDRVSMSSDLFSEYNQYGRHQLSPKLGTIKSIEPVFIQVEWDRGPGDSHLPDGGYYPMDLIPAPATRTVRTTWGAR